MLTKKQLEEMRPGTVFDAGKVANSPEGIYMVDNDIGRIMIWAAKRGAIPDWTIYIYWEESGIDFVLSNGDKLRGTDNIRKLVKCDDEALAMYRK